MATSKDKYKSKLPTTKEILPVFSTILFVIFTWTLYRMFWQLPSWLGYLSIWIVFILGAYVLAFALVESLVLLGLLLLLNLVFPARHLRNKFIIQGFVITATLGFASYIIQRKISALYKLELWQLLAYPLLALGALIILVLVTSHLLDRFKVLSRLIASLADRMTVFAYIYIPLGLAGMVVVLFRNIF